MNSSANNNPAPAFTEMTDEQMKEIKKILVNDNAWINKPAYALYNTHLDSNNQILDMSKEYIYNLITKNIQPNLTNYDLTLVAARKCMVIIDPTFKTRMNDYRQQPSLATSLPPTNTPKKYHLPTNNVFTLNNQKVHPPPGSKDNNYNRSPRNNNIPGPNTGGYKKQHRKSINAKSMKTPKRGTRVSVRRLSGENLSSKGITRNNRRKSRKTKLRKSMKK
jgi:hypothetical protein